MNNPMINQNIEQINNMNNLINDININNMNFPINNINNYNFIQNNNENKIRTNIMFQHQSGRKTIISIERDKTIKELLNKYFQNNNRTEFINNYEKKFKFIYNAKNIVNEKEEKIENIIMDPATIIVHES